MKYVKLFENFSNQLNDYMSGKAKYEPELNILMNARNKDLYGELGKYICSKYPDGTPPFLPLFTKGKRYYSSVAISFFSSYLGQEALQKMFGEPLYHNEFGEGSHGDNDPDLKGHDYASYFVKVDGVDLHIGFDHRGTRIEANPAVSPEKLVEVFKSLFDKYYEFSK